MTALVLSSLVLYVVGVVVVAYVFATMPLWLRPPTGWPGAALLALLWPVAVLLAAIDFVASCVVGSRGEP